MGINSLDDFMTYLSGGLSLMMDSKITGSCLCGSVKYTLIGCPLKRAVCHCKNCQKASGTAFAANSFFKKDQITIEGKEHLRVFGDSNTSSGTTLNRQFCANCGSQMFFTAPDHPERKDMIVVATGTMDVDHQSFENDWKPDVEFFVENRRAFLPYDLTNVKH